MIDRRQPHTLAGTRDSECVAINCRRHTLHMGNHFTCHYMWHPFNGRLQYTQYKENHVFYGINEPMHLEIAAKDLDA